MTPLHAAIAIGLTTSAALVAGWFLCFWKFKNLPAKADRAAEQLEQVSIGAANAVQQAAGTVATDLSKQGQ